MIPYFQIPPVHFLGLAIHAFEILTALGIYLGIRYALTKSKSRCLPEKNIIDAIMISVIAGFIGAHVMHIFFYQRDFSNPMRLLEVWKGISSTGGFLAGGIFCWLYVKAKKLPVYDVGDCLITGLLVAQFFGRIGCFTAHDHPGALTSFPLAVIFPDGPRHDLGFYEALLLLGFLIMIHLQNIKVWLNQVAGRWMISGLLFYGSIRFLLDFLRATDIPSADPRYIGLTPAQFVCVGFVALGIYMIKIHNVSKQQKPANTV
jgi:phosphatidylglycerol:prolipoprotein diacylglycerol transferase